jgi:hypothetical protein
MLATIHEFTGVASGILAVGRIVEKMSKPARQPGAVACVADNLPCVLHIIGHVRQPTVFPLQPLDLGNKFCRVVAKLRDRWNAGT